MTKFFTFIAGLAIAVAIVGTSVTAVGAEDALTPCDLDSGSSLCSDSGDVNKSESDNLIKNILNILLYIVGAAAVIVIIIAGIRYTVSSGNQQAVEGAKKMLIGGVIGVAVAVFAYAIVNFVLVQFGLGP